MGKLVGVSFIKEIRFQTCVANPFLVEKSNDNLQMCVDFRDLNKGCPKDCYSLSCIKQLVYATLGYEVLSFMDAYPV